MSSALRQKAPIHRTLRHGARHYSENWQAWQTVKKANLVRLIKVSLFDPGVSRKSPVSWHFLAVLRPVFSSLLPRTSQSGDITCPDGPKHNQLHYVVGVSLIFLSEGASANLYYLKTPCRTARENAQGATP